MKSLVAVPFLKDANVSVRADLLALAAVLIIALCVRFYSITVPVIWYDEAYSLLLARETPARIWALTALDVHPPLYYVLLHYWVAVWGESPLAARAFSVLADVGTLLLCIKLMSLISTRRATWIAAVLLALLPISVHYSQEVRMYTLLGFWLMAASVALLCWVRHPEQKRFALIYVLLMTAAFYTHYFAGLCVLVHWLFWWQSRATRDGAAISAHSWLVANIAIVFLYLPWIPHLLYQLADTEVLNWIEPVTLQKALALVWQFTVMGDDTLQSPEWKLVPLVLMLLFAVTITSSKTSERPIGWLLVNYFFVPLTALYLIALIHALFVTRYLQFSAPALAMITAVALDRWGSRRALLSKTVLLICVVAQLHGLTMVYRQTDGLEGTSARRESEFSTLMNQLNHNARPGDEIIVSTEFWVISVDYYNTTGIKPKIATKLSIDSFLKLTSRGALSLIDDPAARVFIDGVTNADFHSRRVWWITYSSLPDGWSLFKQRRTPSLVFDGVSFSLYLFTPDAPAIVQASTSATSYAAAISCGSKLSARAICHIRE
ncbi:glycosyltransferase family 39 protein [Pseudomonas sp. TH49]|uniref:glycosyltransferase family 39 protein n=1 Tax=Pseudomonas sp. TH49 TaxID=2796413 RepID=UPI001914A94A|nr:glycosyltransferase family 39 protein [Pseudomonas sp. TH49]MBK5342338.1 glycosyltransferase family 39 protein [Pseudomonas sp. TH49]